MVARLLRLMPRLVRSRSVTTRLPRSGERRGREYQFATPMTFDRWRRGDQLLEWAKVHGACYGTPKGPITRALAQGRDVILSIDVQGARQVRRALGTQAVLIFLLPPSMEDLRQRLVRRRTDTPAAISQRLAVAKREVACATRYDYQIINDQLEHTVKAVRVIVNKGR